MKCIAFFNFGNKCILELLVATYTLRKHYNGEIVWVLANNDHWNKKISNHIAALNVKIEWLDFNMLSKNTKSAIKPSIFKYLFSKGYESVIMCDGDLVFMDNIDDLFEPLNKSHDVVLTNFCNWLTKGNIMRQRIAQLKGIIDDVSLKNLLDGYYKAVNIGVMGFNKRGIHLLDKWAEITKKLEGKHIADEIAAHYLLLFVNTFVADKTYNASAKIGNLDEIEKNKVIHYHGGSQGGGDVDIRYEDRRRSSRIWYAYFYELEKANIIPNIREWIQYSTGGIHEILKANPDLPEECYKEFIK